ncbi:MAG: hypothetical protein IPN33_00270 [Saprospiraceae bacterium]|nr:hypothetical protein [Saprospiraceae bacterium]
MRNKEFSWYMLSNAPGFGAKSIHYIYENLQANNLSINDLFDLGDNELQRLFPEIGRGKLSRANFSCFPSLENDDRLCSNFENSNQTELRLLDLMMTVTQSRFSKICKTMHHQYFIV